MVHMHRKIALKYQPQCHEHGIDNPEAATAKNHSDYHRAEHSDTQPQHKAQKHPIPPSTA
jgi:hypothetical protein